MQKHKSPYLNRLFIERFRIKIYVSLSNFRVELESAIEISVSGYDFFFFSKCKHESEKVLQV